MSPRGVMRRCAFGAESRESHFGIRNEGQVTTTEFSTQPDLAVVPRF